MKIACQNCNGLIDFMGQASVCEFCDAVNLVEDYPAYGDVGTLVSGAVEEFKANLDALDDDALIDELNEHLSTLPFSRETDKALAEFFEKGKLSRKYRKLLEACYMLVHSGGFLE